MAFVKRTWKDRISEFPNRRTINDGNVTKQVTVGRDEGNITEAGDSFDASNMNDLEQRIEDAYGDVQGLVASEVAQQYDSSNVIFDAEPTEGHGTGYTVTSEGIKTAIDSGLVHTKTESGSLVHITDGADNIPVKSLVSQIIATGGGGTPDAPIAISGFDSGIVTRCGKNLFDIEKWLTDNNVPFTKVGDYYKFTVANSLYSNIFEFPFGTKTLSVDINQSETTATNIRVRVKLQDGTIDNNVYQTQTPYTSNIKGIALNWSGVGTLCIKMQVEASTTATTYEAYNGNAYTFAFGQTVYGGHFDNKGNLVVTFLKKKINELTWNYVNISGSERFYSSSISSEIEKTISIDTVSTLKCSCYETISERQYAQFANDNIIAVQSTGNIVIRDTSLTSVQALLNAVGDQEICYPLANPITLSITTQDIPTLLGENNIFSNCGDCEVTYYVDTEAIYAIRDVIDEFAMQSDWNEADNTKADYIKNKPTIPANADFSLSGLSDTDISSTSAGQVLTFDGDNWVNSNIVLPSVKYEEINVTFDASGEGTLFNSVKFVVGLKDIPSDQLYVGYVSYIAGSTIKIKALSRTAIAFSSQNNVSSTRKVGVYYLDNIATQ